MTSRSTAVFANPVNIERVCAALRKQSAPERDPDTPRRAEFNAHLRVQLLNTVGMPCSRPISRHSSNVTDVTVAAAGLRFDGFAASGRAVGTRASGFAFAGDGEQYRWQVADAGSERLGVHAGHGAVHKPARDHRSCMHLRMVPRVSVDRSHSGEAWIGRLRRHTRHGRMQRSASRRNERLVDPFLAAGPLRIVPGPCTERRLECNHAGFRRC